MIKHLVNKFYLVVLLFLLNIPMAMAAEICKDSSGNVVEITAGSICSTATNGYGDVAPLCLKGGSCKVSGDGSINISDAVVILRLALGLVDPTTVIWPATGGTSGPIANAGADQSVGTRTTVTLDGSLSKSANTGEPIAFIWKQTSGTTVTLSSNTATKPTFTAPSTADTLIFSLTVSDGKTSSVASTTTVKVTAADPSGLTALDGTLTVDEDTVATGTLKANQKGTGTLSYTIVKFPTIGKAVLTNFTTGAYRYTPNANANGQDSFTFKVSDGTNDSNEAKISVTVKAVNDTPVISTIPNQTVKKDQPTEVIAFTASDVESTVFQFSASADNVTLVPDANIAIGGTMTNPTIQVTPAPGKTGGAEITVMVTDGQMTGSTKFSLFVGCSTGFCDNGNGTITDTKTGLIGLKNANCFGVQTWEAALSKAATLASGACGLTDGSTAGQWRLPTKDELPTYMIWKSSDIVPGVQTTYYHYYWSSTTRANDTSDAWVVYLDYGYVTSNGKATNAFVWPVRGGQ